jgi:Fe-S cluster biogenesis protein NfuA
LKHKRELTSYKHNVSCRYSTAANPLYSAVKVEVDRLLPAIEAMGGSVKIVKVDSTQGLVELNFCGASRVKTGLELALRDIPTVKDVKFLS